MSASDSLSQAHRHDDAPGVIGVTKAELPPLPDAIMTDPTAGRMDPRRWFTKPDQKLEIEIGSGKGTFLVEQCSRRPDVNYLGIEYEPEFYYYTADRLRRRNVCNCRMLKANAVEFFKWRMPDEIVSVIHLYYSDPWPKTKHHKNRVIQHDFLADALRVLVPGGELRVVTDHQELWAWDLDHFAQWCGAGDQEMIKRAYGHDWPAASSDAPRSPVSCAGSWNFEILMPTEWANEGGLVGTNYEKKMTGPDNPPRGCILRKTIPTQGSCEVL